MSKQAVKRVEGGGGPFAGCPVDNSQGDPTHMVVKLTRFKGSKNLVPKPPRTKAENQFFVTLLTLLIPK